MDWPSGAGSSTLASPLLRLGVKFGSIAPVAASKANSRLRVSVGLPPPGSFTWVNEPPT